MLTPHVTTTPARRLAIRPGAVGDLIVSLPALEALRADYFEVWVASQNVPLVRFASRVRSIAATGIDLLGIAEPDPRLISGLRGFDSIVSWYGANRPEFQDLAAQLGLPFHFLSALPSGRLHAVDFYLEQVGAAPSVTRIPRIPTPARERSGAVLHPFSGSPKKNWPLSRFHELARALEPRGPVAWCAGPADPLAGAIRIADLYDLACRLAAAEIYIGNDSGITHLAAAAGTPVVALFGPTDPKVWSPRGEKVRVIARETIDAIAVEDVLAAVSEILDH